MARKISQETFDDVVKENMEDFEMDSKEALVDAINQFTKQGVDMSSIDISGGIGRQEVLDAITELNDCIEKESGDVIASIEKLAALCTKENEYHNRNRVFVMDKGGVNSLHLLLDPNQSEVVIKTASSFLEDLSKNNVDIRDFFEPGGCARLLVLLRKFSEPSNINQDMLISMLSLAKTVAKTEYNKNELMKSGVGSFITTFLIDHTKNYIQYANVLTECCSLLRAMCIHDDLRKDMSCAYENGRFFLKQANLAQYLMRLSSYFTTHPNLASSALSAAKNLIATEEAVAIMSQHGAITLIHDILSYSDSSVYLVRSCIGLMRNVCADDIRKDRLVSDGSLDLLINIMSQENYAKDSSLMEHAVACLAQISLRSPNNALKIVNCGSALEILAKTMRRYYDRSGLQRQGCLTVRNIAARGVELRPLLLDTGFEDILRAAGRIQDVVDEAYAALRDLGCEVHYIKINAEGKAEPVYEQFGGNPGKLQFNPIYEEDERILEKVQEEARAPFAAPISTTTTDNSATMEATTTQKLHSCDEHTHSDSCSH